MKTSSKAIFLSALVLPGLGQITLKRYKTGIAIMFAVVISVYKIISIATEKANAILNDIMVQGGVLDIATIMNATTQATDSTGNATYSFYLWIIIACWLLSIFDAWFTGKKAARKNI